MLGSIDSRNASFDIPQYVFPQITLDDIPLPQSSPISVPTIPPLGSMTPIAIGSINIPTPPIPTFQIPTVGIPRVTRIDFGQAIFNVVDKGVKQQLGEWNMNIFGTSIGFDSLRDLCAAAVAWACKQGGYYINTLWDTYLQPQIDSTERRINDTISNVTSTLNQAINQVINSIQSVLITSIQNTQQAVNKALGAINTDINQAESDITTEGNSIINQVNSTFKDAINSLNTDLQSLTQSLNTNKTQTVAAINQGFNQVGGAMSDAVKSMIQSLYTSMGLDPAMTLNPVQLRNTSSYGFDVYCLGSMKLYWIAISMDYYQSVFNLPNPFTK